jgi:hypothetical protein
VSQTACQSCGAEKHFVGLCHACFYKFSGGDPYPEKIVAAVKKWFEKENNMAIYMEKNALAFLRAWPNVPEVLRPVYSRFYDTGLIFIDDNVDCDHFTWPGQLRLTERGEALKQIVDAQSFNFFIPSQLEPIMPQGYRHEEHFVGGEDRRIFKDNLRAAGYQAHGETASVRIHSKPESAETLASLLKVAAAAAQRLTRLRK